MFGCNQLHRQNEEVGEIDRASEYRNRRRPVSIGANGTNAKVRSTALACLRLAWRLVLALYCDRCVNTFETTIGM